MRAAIIALLLVVATVHAQPPAANAHARRGVALYNLGKYAEAILAFEAAYELFQSDALMFNLAQAHRQLGHCEDALVYYRRFLAGRPAPALAAQVETLLPKLEAACKTKLDRPTGPVATAPEPAPAEEPAAAAPVAAIEEAPSPIVEEAAAAPRVRAIAALTAGTVMSNRAAPAVGVKGSVATPIPWLRGAEVGVVGTAARLLREERDRVANLTSIGLVARVSSEQPWARFAAGAEAGGAFISSLDASSGVIPGVRRAGLWVPFARAEVAAERTIAPALAVRLAVAAGVSPRQGPMLEPVTQVDVCLGVRYER